MNTRTLEANSSTTRHNILLDRYRRPLQDLRISVIDRCNFRCTYCMPTGSNINYTFLEQEQWLTFNEIERLTRLFTGLGVTKVRLTGGEPLLRPNLPDLIARLRHNTKITDLALTTNGSLLSEFVVHLKESGLNRITVSLDTLDAQTFTHISGGKGNVTHVLKGIQKAEEAGFDQIKINIVVQKNVNDHQILDLIKYFRGTNAVLRFIEYMDVGNCNHWNVQDVVPSTDLVELINAHFPIKPVKSAYFGEVASRYQYRDGRGEIGFITSVTQPFCASCTRARLSADGTVYTCLFASKGINLQKPLRKGASDADLLKILTSAWANRQDRYSEMRAQIPPHQTSAGKVEMFQIGG